MIQRVLSLDVGDVRIGIAMSDLLGITAQGKEIYTRCGDVDKDSDYIVDFARSNSVKKIVFGLPKNMDGTEGFQATNVHEFADVIARKINCEQIFVDERLTTVSAKRALHEGGANKKKVKGTVDKIAAVLILQSYLDQFGG